MKFLVEFLKTFQESAAKLTKHRPEHENETVCEFVWGFLDSKCKTFRFSFPINAFSGQSA